MPLCLPDKDRRILISADASDIAVGGVVWLECTPHSPEGTPLNDRKVEPLAFYSKLLTDSQQNWATIQKELYAILLILTESQLSSYLISRELTIFTDHKNLAYLISAPEKNRMVKRWIPILSEYLFTIVHTSGEDNHWADMMSRNVIKDATTESINNIVTYCPEHLFSITDSRCPTDEDTEYQTLSTESIDMIDDALINKSKLFDAWLSKVRSTQVEAIKNNDPLFQHPSTWFNEEFQLYMNSNNKILIPSALVKTTLNHLHGFPHAGHPSIKDSIDRLKSSDYFWPSMINDMKTHCKQCPACQKTAPLAKTTIKSSGNLWSDKPFAKMNVDTIGPLPTDTSGNIYLLVFIDSFTRFTILCPLKELNAHETAYSLVCNVCAIFGIPDLIHSDNGKEFANHVFNDVCKQFDITTNKSIPSFSPSNGLVERRHRDILQALRKMLIDFNDYDNWSKYIPLVQLLVNTTKSRVTGFTPYELMFGSNTNPGSDPSKIISCLTQNKISEDSFLADYQSKLTRILKKREEAETTQSSIKSSITTVDTPSLFAIGDLVLRSNKAAKKLHGKQEGPYLVTDIPSKSSLELQNFVTGHRFRSSIHLCTKYLSDKPSSDEFHKAVASCDSEEMVIIEILDQRDSPTGPICSVVWFDGDTTEEPLSLVKNTRAYSSFIKLNPHAKPKSKPKTKSRSTRNRQAIPSNTPDSVILTTPPAKRTRSSKKGKK
ncbi:hypothetical protein GEMRC1_010913 [Eukaryota sp. GEM-RC1]